MNIIYRIVRNAATGKWTVASEFAKGRGKQPTRRAAALVGALSLSLAAAASASEPIPTDESACFDTDGIEVTCVAEQGRSIGAFADTDPVDVGQLRGSVQSIADALGGGAGVDAAGVLTAPSYVLGGSTYTSVGSALTGLDTRVSDTETAIANIPNGSRFIAVLRNEGAAASAGGGPNTVAVGPAAVASGNAANAFGADARATNNGALAVGVSTRSSGNNSTAVGFGATASGASSSAIGGGARTTGTGATAVGRSSVVASDNSTAIGQGANIAAASTGSVAIGYASVITASAVNALAMGTSSRVTAANASALGDQAQATASNAVALGSASVADRASSVSFGTVGAERQLVNVADATAATDAVNLGQLSAASASAAAALGGGAGINADGTLSAPTYTIADLASGSDATVDNVGDALGTINNSVLNVDGRVSALSTAIDAGTAGLVQQAGVGADITVAAANAGSRVDFSGTAGARVLDGVADGALAAGSQQAVNGGQLQATNAQVLNNTTTIADLQDGLSDASRYVKANGLNDGSDDAQATGQGAIALGRQANASVADTIAIGSAAQVQGTASIALGTNARATGNGSVALGAESVADRDNVVSVGAGPLVGNGTRQIVNVANGTQNTDAVTVQQLRPLVSALGGGAAISASNGVVTGPRYTVQGTTHDNVGDALGGIDTTLTRIDGRVTNAEGDITTINSVLNNLSAGTAGLVQQAATDAVVTVAAGTGGTRVDFSGTDGARQLKGVANGTDTTDAVNVAQLSQAIDGVRGGGTRYFNADGKNDGSDDAVATGSDSMAAGASAQAIGAASVAMGRGAQAQSDSSVALGANARATGAGSVALGAGSVADRDNVVSVGAGPLVGNGSRQIVNVANGTENTDAVNVQQLRPLVSALGGGAAISTTNGVVSGPSYTVQGTTHDNVGDALGTVDTTLTRIDGRVTTAEGDITTINSVLNNLSGGTAGLVQQTAADAVVTVAAGSGGTRVDFTGTDGARQLKGVADATDTTDAVNLSQLSKAIDGVRGDGTRYFKAGGKNDGSDDAVATGSGAMAAGASAQADGASSVALGQGANAQADNSVALGANSVADRANAVSIGADGAERQITHVADGSEDTDAVNLRQLKAAGLIGDAGQSLDAVVYDQDSNRSQVTFAGAGGTVLANVADGRIAAGSREAVNGGQVAALREQLQDRIGDIDNRVTRIENNPGVGAGGGNGGGTDDPYYDASAGGGSAIPASSGDVVSNGGAATASGQGAVAAGAGANASADGSVALGAGSVADRENTVSVGSVGAERQITHVSAGIQDSDAVNVSQLNQRMADANAYTDGRVQDMWDNVNERFDQASRQANRGIAGAAALVQVTPYLPGKTVLNAGMATYRGETALGVGVSRWSDNGRININAGVSAARGDRPIFRVGVGVVLGD